VVAIVAIIVIAVLALTYYPTSQSGINTHTAVSSTTANEQASTCTNNPIQSELTSINGQTVTAPKVATYTATGAGGAYVKVASASGSLTQNALNTASAYTQLPIYQTYSGTQVYNESVTVSSAAQAPIMNQFGVPIYTVSCNTPASSSNNVPTIQGIATVYTGPSAGTSASTGVESVVNSQITQTNSVPAAFPTAQSTWTDYVQVFGNNNIFGIPSTLVASTNLPLTTPSGQVTSGIVTYSAFAIVSFNQTITLNAPGSTLLHGIYGSTSIVVPLTSNGICNATAVATTNPCIGASFSFNVQENVSPTGHHIDGVVIIVDNTILQYIVNNFGTPALTSYPAAGNGHVIPTGFTGITLPSSWNGPAQLTTQDSAFIETY
jgi:hypothetical protein